MEPGLGSGAGPDDGHSPTALASLRRFARRREPLERCELCDAGLAPEHAHLVEVSSQGLVCACDACAILFSGQAAAKYRRVPRDPRFLPDFRLTDEDWGGLQLPINLAFFAYRTPAGRVVASYPSPAGATEAHLPPEAWTALVDANPALIRLEPDVEALLVNRMGTAREHYRVGIDECYKLVGLIRTHWRGLSGGAVAWDEIARFFAVLKGRSS